MLDAPAVSVLRLARILERREVEDAMEARAVALFPWIKDSDRSQWFDRAQAALAEASAELPTAEGQFTDPALQAHVRKVEAKARAQAEATIAARRKAKP